MRERDARAQAKVRQTLLHDDVHAVPGPEVLVARKFSRRLLEARSELTKRLAA